MINLQKEIKDIINVHVEVGYMSQLPIYIYTMNGIRYNVNNNIVGEYYLKTAYNLNNKFAMV